MERKLELSAVVLRDCRLRQRCCSSAMRLTFTKRAPKPADFCAPGIPEYRLPDAVVDTEVARIAELGANFLYCREVGKDVSMEELKEKYDAVLVAVGIGPAADAGDVRG